MSVFRRSQMCIRDSSQSFKDTIHFVTFSLKLIFPGAFFFPGHVVGGMIAGHDHQWGQNDTFRSFFTDQLLDKRQIRISFYSARCV